MPPLSLDVAAVGDRAAFSVEQPGAGMQMQGVGFVVAIQRPPNETRGGVAFIAIVNHPQLIALPTESLHVVERGALLRSLSPVT